MKKIIIKLSTSVLVLLTLVSTSVSATEKAYSWSTPRNGNKQPIFPSIAESVSKYDGYYIDKNHGDDCSDRVLYLTFDAGYENGNIERIADVMKEKRVFGAFFVLDNLLINNTELVKRLKSDGNLICNHTKNHKDLTKMTPDEISRDLKALDEICMNRCGFSLDRYFRFPEGKYSETALKTVSELGYKTIFWSFGYADWDNNAQPSCELAKKKILSNTHNGAIILLHPTSKTNADIIGDLIDEWRKMGYRFGTLDELTAQSRKI